ncbi:TM2 domain-containing protein [Nocardia camponoti]|uniref:TM2 domain-containing protein n=1 Tax=Nocardia camponoti TaxID=1616106 RepID=A0A917VDV3_9NOCA|nr:TM2 domain-containing protein [Nocardia camponoti]GGK68193.1 hypothetical protein GCM10011591_45360 [Nocardia camponoti]
MTDPYNPNPQYGPDLSKPQDQGQPAAPQYGAPASDPYAQQPGYPAQPQFGQPQYGQPAQPQYGQPAYPSQPQYGQPVDAYGQPVDPYGQPQPAYGQPFGAPTGYNPADPEAPYGRDIYGVPFSDKQKLTAGLLEIFLGSFGVGRFYLGYTGLGIAQIAVVWLTCGIGAIWPLIDGIMMLTGKVPDVDGRPLRD